MLRKFSGSDIHSIMMEADQIDLIPLARSAQPKRYFSIFFLPLVVDVTIKSDSEHFAELLGLNKLLPSMSLPFALAHSISLT